MRKVNILAAFLLTCMLYACEFKSGSGVMETQTRNVSAFTGIEVSDGLEVILEKGAQNVRVEADDNLINDVVTEVSGSVLKIYFDGNSLNDSDIKVYVTVDDLTEIRASASAEIKIEGIYRTTSLKCTASSGAEIEGEIDAPEVVLTASSGSDIKLLGRARSVQATASSGSEIDAINLKAEDAEVTVSSGAKIEVFSSIRLNAAASSGGKVEYTGGATNLKVSESSGGVIRSK